MNTSDDGFDGLSSRMMKKDNGYFEVGGKSRNSGTLEYKELYAYNQHLERDIGVLKQEFKSNLIKLKEFKQDNQRYKEKNRVLEQQ